MAMTSAPIDSAMNLHNLNSEVHAVTPYYGLGLKSPKIPYFVHQTILPLLSTVTRAASGMHIMTDSVSRLLGIFLTFFLI